MSEKDLETARAQFRSIVEIESALRARLKKDHEYIDGVNDDGTGMRWTAEERSRAMAVGIQPLEYDASSGPISQVANALADARPAADMLPIGDGADPEKAEVWEGMLHRVQTSPEAEFAAAYAAGHLTKLGRAYWLLREEYPEFNGDPADPANWDREIVRDWIENQHAVFRGPSTRADGTDCQCAFILQPYTKEPFDDRFGEGQFEENKTAFALLADTDRAGLSAWQTPKTVMVVSWYRIKSRTVEILGPIREVNGERVQQKRTVKDKYCCHSIITATREYEFEELPIPYVPVIEGRANLSNVDGKQDVRGMVRRIKDPQNMLDGAVSYAALQIQKGSRTEVVAAAGQISGGFAKFWNMAEPLDWREYNPTDYNNKLNPPPQIVQNEPPIQALSLFLAQSESFVRKAAGAWDVDSDETGAERSKMSGRAMIQRDRRSELVNSEYRRAFRFMIQAETKILKRWIPKVYSAARVMRITGRDQDDFTAVTYFGDENRAQAEQMGAGLMVPQPDGSKALPEGVKGIFDLSTGRYDIKTDVQTNPLTQRQETLDIAQAMLEHMPPEAQAKIAPVILENTDGPAGRKLAAAMKPKQGTVPIEEAKKAQEVINALAGEVQALKDDRDRKAAELASKERIALAEIEAKVTIEREKMLHESKMKEFEIQKLKAQQEFDAHQASLAHERGIEAGDHRDAAAFALREPKPTNGAGASA